MLVVDMRGDIEGKANGINLRSGQSAMSVNYLGKMTLTRFRGAVQGDMMNLGLFFTIALLSCGCSSKNGKMKLTRWHDKFDELNNILMASSWF